MHDAQLNPDLKREAAKKKAAPKPPPPATHKTSTTPKGKTLSAPKPAALKATDGAPPPDAVKRTSKAPARAPHGPPAPAKTTPPAAQSTLLPFSKPIPTLDVTNPKPIQKENTPSFFGRIEGIFKKELGGLQALGNKAMKGIKGAGLAVAQQAKALATQPANALKNAAGAASAYAGQKINQFKKWYATPEGKAAFWKGVTAVGVGVITVASAGTLTAPALMLAGGISAVGGVAAQVVHNQVFNHAAAQKARQDKSYTYQKKNALQGVTLKSMAIDGMIGAVGGPALRFAGKIAVGTAGALARGAMPALKGMGQLTLAAGRGVARKTLPAAARTFLKGAGNSIKSAGTNAWSAASGFGTSMKDNLVTPTLSFLKNKKDAIGQFATNTANWVSNTGPAKQLGKLAYTLRKQRTALRMKDIRLLKRVMDSKPVMAVRNGNRKVNEFLHGKATKLNAGKNTLLDWADNKAHKVARSLKTSRPGQYMKGRADAVAKRVDDIIATSDNPNLVRAFTQFRESSQAIRTHLSTVWGDAGQELSKGYGRLFGEAGAAQAEMRTLVASEPLYTAQLDAAKAAAKARLQAEALEDAEKLARHALRVRGTRNPDRSVMQDQIQVERRNLLKNLDVRATREAEKFVARHATPELQALTLTAYKTAGMKKALKSLFGDRASRQGLLARTGYILSNPVRTAVNDRLEKFSKIASILKSGTPIAGAAQAFGTAFGEAAEKTVTAELTTRFENNVKAKFGEAGASKPDEKKAKPDEKDEGFGAKMVDDAWNELVPVKFDDFWKDIQKNAKMDGEN